MRSTDLHQLWSRIPSVGSARERPESTRKKNCTYVSSTRQTPAEKTRIYSKECSLCINSFLSTINLFAGSRKIKKTSNKIIRTFELNIHLTYSIRWWILCYLTAEATYRLMIWELVTSGELELAAKEFFVSCCILISYQSPIWTDENS
jgi:hypothetical protein